MPKKGITIRLDEDLIDRLEDEANEQGVSRSEYIRQILAERHREDELQQQINNLQQRLEDREERISELEDQLARRSQLEDKIEDVQIELREDRDDRNAPFFVKWYRWFRE